MKNPILKSVSLISLMLTVLFSANENAHATGGVYCQSKDNKAEISVGMGRVIIYAPINAYVRHGDKEWMMEPQGDEPEIGGSQGMWENQTLSIDLTDDQVTKIIASLRVDYAGDEDDEDGYEGTLTFENEVVHKVYCLFE